MKGNLRKNILKLIVLLCVFGNTVAPAPLYSQDSDNKGVPSWVKVTFWGTFAVFVGIELSNEIFFKSGHEESGRNNSTSNAIRYVLDNNQEQLFDSLNTSQQRMDYLDYFWDTLEGEYETETLRHEFETRCLFADSIYNLPYKSGWQTDRGRIYILYGPPDDKVIQPFVPDPYLKISTAKYADLEIWYYNAAQGHNQVPIKLSNYNTGQMFFVFYRRSGHAEFDQIFSTEAGEKIDPGLYGSLIIIRDPVSDR